MPKIRKIEEFGSRVLHPVLDQGYFDLGEREPAKVAVIQRSRPRQRRNRLFQQHPALQPVPRRQYQVQKPDSEVFAANLQVQCRLRGCRKQAQRQPKSVLRAPNAQNCRLQIAKYV